ncbi:hypothetical protein ACFL35_17115 [Candidatus Riflebacteria bacterium]
MNTKWGIFFLFFFCLFNLKSVMGEEEAEYKGFCGAPLCENISFSDAQVRGSLKFPAAKSIRAAVSAGQTRNFYTYDLARNRILSIPSTCRVVGKNCYIFVANSAWSNPGKYFGGREPGEVVTEIAAEYDNTILPLTRSWMGEEPLPPDDIDGESKVFFLILDIVDSYSYSGSGGYVAGYFSGNDQKTTAQYTYSNELDMLYMDCYPAKVASKNFFSTMAHEFAHLITYKRGAGKELSWINEGTSTLVQSFYNPPSLNYKVASFRENPNIPLVEARWSNINSIPYYGQSYLFLLHLKNRFGGRDVAEQQAFIQKLVEEDLPGKDGLEAVTGVDFNQIFEDYSLANGLNLETANKGYWGYPEEFDDKLNNDLHLPVKTYYHNLMVDEDKEVSAEVVNWGNRYYKISGRGTVNLNFEGSDTDGPYVVTLVNIPISGEPATQTLTLKPDKQGSIEIPGLGSTVKRVLIRVSAEKDLQGDTGNSAYSFKLSASLKPTMKDLFLAPLVNPGLGGSHITMVARMANGFYETPKVQLTVNGIDSTLAMKKVSDSVYHGSYTFPSGFTGDYTASVTAKISSSASISKNLSFTHNFK